MVRLRASSQRCSSARRSDCAGSGCSAGSVFSRHPASSNVTCRLSATPSRKRSNASDRRAFRWSTAASGSTGNPVRAQNASRTRSHWAVGRKKASKRPKFLRALDGEVAGLELVAHLEEQRALPAAAVRHAVAADERLQRRWREVQRHIGRQAAAPPPRGVRGRPAAPTASARCPCPARRRTSSGSETARRTGSARACRSAVCSKRAFRSPRVQFARSDWSSRSCSCGQVKSGHLWTPQIRPFPAPRDGS